MAAGAARATPVSDPVGDFIPSYTGPHVPDLDVISANVSVLGGNVIVSGTLNGAVGATTGGFYVWGIDRGRGATTSNFAAIGLPNIIFDSVVVVRPGGASAVNDLVSGLSTPLPGSQISIAGNTVQAIVPLSELPSEGFSADNYFWNLWPRFAGAVGNAQVADFAPDDHDAPVTVPEPASLALLAFGLTALTISRRKMAMSCDSYSVAAWL
jgi:hypothetical protein